MKNNKIIALFMGDINSLDAKVSFNKNCTVDELQYHKSWDWLMPVVDKIESLNFSIEMNKQEEGDYQCLIIKKDILVQTFSNNKIEAVYNAVIKFIKNK
jgi:hypothetical protein